MSKTIDELFYGNIAPNAQMRPSPEYRRQMRAFEKTAGGLAAKLPEELRGELDGVLAEQVSLMTLEVTQAFGEGFRLAVRLMAEAFCEDGEEE